MSHHCLCTISGQGRSSWLAYQVASSGHRAIHLNLLLAPRIHYSLKPELFQQLWLPQRIILQKAAAAAAVLGETAAEAQGATEARLYALYDFVSAHGRLPQVQDQHKGVAVGQWSEHCRLQHQLQKLDEQLAAALQSIPEWTWQLQTPVVQGSFEQSIMLLRRFQQQHGRLPKMRKNTRSTRDDEELAATEVLRQLLEQRRRGVLTQRQIDTISTSLPGWRWDSRVRSPPLDELMTILQDFVERQGSLPKQAEKLPSGFHIGEWITERRSEHSRGQLERDVAEALQQQVPGWSWNPVDDAFETNLAILRRFAVEHRRMPTQREEFEGVRIGAWCNKRRLQHRQGFLPADRAALLESVEGWWWTAEDMPEE